MVSALGNGVKGGKWFSLIDKVVRPATLDIAWQRVARNKGAAGVDGRSIERFAAQSDRYLAELQASLADGSYRPDPVKRVEIPKGDGKTRPLGIPAVKDRIVQTALKMVTEPIFGVQFRPGSFGFRPGRGCKDALREVDRLLKAGYTHVVDADLKSYFDTIPHDRSRTAGRRWDEAKPTTGSGPMPSSRNWDCSPFAQPMKTLDTPNEETSDWRAVCGKTASTVRRAGRA
jgi:RNA-directed DNA polymerase